MKQFDVRYEKNSVGNVIPVFTWSNRSPFNDVEIASDNIEIVLLEYELNKKYQKL